MAHRLRAKGQFHSIKKYAMNSVTYDRREKRKGELLNIKERNQN